MESNASVGLSAIFLPGSFRYVKCTIPLPGVGPAFSASIARGAPKRALARLHRDAAQSVAEGDGSPLARRPRIAAARRQDRQTLTVHAGTAVGVQCHPLVRVRKIRRLVSHTAHTGPRGGPFRPAIRAMRHAPNTRANDGVLQPRGVGTERQPELDRAELKPPYAGFHPPAR